MLDFISFVGIDEQTEFNDLVNLAKNSNISLEFGILYSNDRMGKDKRYPSLKYIKKFLKSFADYPSTTDNHYGPFMISIHLCGSSIDDFLNGEEKINKLVKHFGSVQLNFSYEKMIKQYGEDKFLKLIVDKIIEYNNDVWLPVIILQHNESKKDFNKKIIEILKKDDPTLFDYQNEIRFLYDGSGGFGKTINNFEPPIEDFVTGYAGGIGPETVKEIVSNIDKIVPANIYYYIDMESRIRENNNFSIDKCNQVLEILGLKDFK